MYINYQSQTFFLHAKSENQTAIDEPKNATTLLYIFNFF